MKVIQFPGAAEPAPEDDTVVPDCRVAQGKSTAQLLRALLKHHRRARRSSASPLTVLARVSVGRRSGSAGVNPLAVLADWLGESGNAYTTEPRLSRHGQHAHSQSHLTEPDPKRSEAFWSAWIEHRDTLRRMALRMLQGSRADAEDALSAAMLRAERAYDPSKIRNPGAWFNRLVRNACIDLHRHRSRTSTIGDNLESTLAEGVPHQAGSWDAAKNAEDILLSTESLLETLCAMLELPEDLLEPLLLRCLEEESYEQISSRMGLSNAAVRKRVQLARQSLQAKMK